MPNKKTTESFLNQPFSTITWIVMIIVLLVVAYVIGYTVGAGQVDINSTPVDTSQAQVQTNTNKVSTAVTPTSQQTYENVNYGFTLGYPTDWTAQDAIQTVGSSSDDQALTLTGKDNVVVKLHVNGSNLTQQTPEATYTVSYNNGQAVLGDKVVTDTDSSPTTGLIQFKGSINGNTYLFTATGVTDQAQEDAVKTIVSSLKLTAK